MKLALVCIITAYLLLSCGYNDDNVRYIRIKNKSGSRITECSITIGTLYHVASFIYIENNATTPYVAYTPVFTDYGEDEQNYYDLAFGFNNKNLLRLYALKNIGDMCKKETLYIYESGYSFVEEESLEQIPSVISSVNSIKEYIYVP